MQQRGTGLTELLDCKENSGKMKEVYREMREDKKC